MNYSELESSLILKNTPRLGPRTWKKLITKYKSSKRAIEYIDEWRSLGISSQVIDGVKQKKWSRGYEKEIKLLNKSRADYILLSDSLYPKMLFEIPDPPIILYYSGNIKLISNPSIAIVGSRKTSHYTREVTLKISRELSSLGITIVSGLALGIDTMAHRGAVLEEGSTIAVLGTGIDVNYPSQNLALKEEISKKGLLVSEFPPATLPIAENFPVRNRIISGLSHGVIVVQAAKRSGSLITAKYALEQNRTIFSIPGPVNDPLFEGNNELIRRGAILIRDGADVLAELSYLKVELKDKGDSSHQESYINSDKEGSLEKKIVDFLRDMGQAGIDELCEKIDIEVPELMVHLVQMEVMGKVKKGLTGKYYIP